MSKPAPTPEDVVTGVEKAMELLADGDVRGATSAWRRLMVKAPKAPEVIVLEGMIALQDGAVEEALKAYEKASLLAPDFPLPLVLAAELCLDDLEDPDRALEFCDKAAKVADDDETLAEVLLIRTDAHIELNDVEQVRNCYEALAKLPIDDPEYFQRVGEVAAVIEDYPAAKSWFAKALDGDPQNADAWHGLGSAYEALGDRDKMVEAWLKTRDIDSEDGDPPWHLTRKDFEKVAEKALAGLPKEILEKLKGVAVLIEDEPSEELVRDGVDPRILGLFSGTPATEKETMSGQPSEPDSIRIFQRNIEGSCEDQDQLVDEIRITVLHETAHYFGLGDDALDAMGLG